MMDKFKKMIQLMRDLVNWEHQTIMSLEHGDSARLVTGAMSRMGVVLWRKCVDITDLLKVSLVGAAAGAEFGKQGLGTEVDGETLAGMRLRTAGEILQVSLAPFCCCILFVVLVLVLVVLFFF
jgi:hypothetical protein